MNIMYTFCYKLVVLHVNICRRDFNIGRRGLKDQDTWGIRGHGPLEKVWICKSRKHHFLHFEASSHRNLKVPVCTKSVEKVVENANRIDVKISTLFDVDTRRCFDVETTLFGCYLSGRTTTSKNWSNTAQSS